MTDFDATLPIEEGDPTRYVLQEWVRGQTPVRGEWLPFTVDLSAGPDDMVMIVTVYDKDGTPTRRAVDLEVTLARIARLIHEDAP